MTKGIAVTESGVDIAKAIDSQKVVDSRWKTLEIADEVVMTMPTLAQTSGAQVIYTHNLGFLPAFEVYDTVLQDYILIPSSQGAGLVSSTTQIYFNGFYNDSGWSNHKVIIRIYNLPITDEYQAPIQQTLPVKTSTKTTRGIKVVRAGHSFVEEEISDFTLNTNAKTLAVQRTGLVLANSGTNFHAIIEHNMGLPPMFLVTYADNQRQWVGVIDPSFVPAVATANSTVLDFRGAQSALIGTFAYIIFKELGDFAL